MKLAKLSLATIVAVGAMSTFASATPLEEAIKGVELNGYLRYRFYGNDGDTEQAAGKTDRHRFTGVLDFTMPVAENLKAGLMLTYNKYDEANNGSASDNIGLGVNRAWFQYGIDGFSVQAGKIAILSPWTDPGYRGAVGNGALALYTGVPGWTFGAGAFVDTNLAPSVWGQNPAGETIHLDELDLGQENLYALAAIGSVGPVNLQVWAASMTNVFDYTFFGDVQFKMAGFSIEGQVSTLKLADETNIFADDTGLYFGVKAGYEIAGFNVEAGYTKNDDDQPIYTLSNDDSSGYIFFGQQLAAQTVNTADAQVIFGTVGYEIDKYSVGAGYGYATAFNGIQGSGDDFGQEWYVEAGYKYSKNFKLSAYYSSLDMEADVNDNNQIRFEAKYSF